MVSVVVFDVRQRPVAHGPWTNMRRTKFLKHTRCTRHTHFLCIYVFMSCLCVCVCVCVFLMVWLWCWSVCVWMFNNQHTTQPTKNIATGRPAAANDGATTRRRQNADTVVVVVVVNIRIDCVPTKHILCIYVLFVVGSSWWNCVCVCVVRSAKVLFICVMFVCCVTVLLRY